MWGKHFASMYEGSMRGSGSAFFAVWGYVISHMVPNREYGTTVELNTEVVAFLIGEDAGVMAEKIEKMCQPDSRSRTKDEEGRKLIKISEYTYRVVNGDYYRKIRNEEQRREYQRVKQAEYRARDKISPERIKELAEAHEEGKLNGYRKRRKFGLPQARVEGEKAGAKAAIKEGFEEAG